MDWPLLKKVLFRFFFIYFLLYIFFNPNGVLPYIDDVSGWYLKPFQSFAIWVGNHILHLKNPVTIHPTGSGDTAYDNVIILVTAFFSLIGTAIWSVADRNAKTYDKLFYWLMVIVRYYVAITMLSYGFYKVVKLQFPFPSFGALMEPYGNSSPMGLAWNFMGYSTAYNYFTGIAELSCGFLLLFRKTTGLGAVVTLVVAGNIMAINYCFDVPVKLLSTHLVGMALFLILKDTNRFISFFLFNKPAAPANLAPHRFKARWKNVTLTSVKVVLIAYTLIFDVKGALEGEKQYGSKAPKPPLYGLYEVKTFVVNKDTLKPLTTDTVRWSKLAISYPENAMIKFMTDSTSYFQFKVDSVKKRIFMNKYTDTVHRWMLSYTQPKKDSLVITGTYKKDSIRITFHRYDASKFLLVRRGFHWISEYPYNR